jgi:hypothetical protein
LWFWKQVPERCSKNAESSFATFLARYAAKGEITFLEGSSDCLSLCLLRSNSVSKLRDGIPSAMQRSKTLRAFSNYGPSTRTGQELPTEALIWGARKRPYRLVLKLLAALVLLLVLIFFSSNEVDFVYRGF